VRNKSNARSNATMTSCIFDGHFEVSVLNGEFRVEFIVEAERIDVSFDLEVKVESVDLADLDRAVDGEPLDFDDELFADGRLLLEGELLVLIYRDGYLIAE